MKHLSLYIIVKQNYSELKSALWFNTVQQAKAKSGMNKTTYFDGDFKKLHFFDLAFSFLFNNSILLGK